MDTFVESSWYFDRFACPDYHEGPLGQEEGGLLDARGSIHWRDRTCHPSPPLFSLFHPGAERDGVGER